MINKQVILITSVGLLLTGCASSKPLPHPTTIQTDAIVTMYETQSESDDVAIQYSDVVRYQLAKSVQESISTSNYQALLEVCDVGEFSVVTADDLKLSISNNEESDLRYLMGKGCLLSEFTDFDIGGYFTIKNENKKVTFYFVHQADNTYKVDLSNFYYKDALLGTPGDVDVSINNITLDNNKSVPVKNNGKFERRKKYTVTLPNHDKLMVHYTNTMFGDLDASTTDAGKDEERHQKLTAIPRLNDTQKEEAFNGVKELLNAMWVDVSNDVHNKEINRTPDYNNYKKYFSDVVSDEDIQKAVKQMSSQVNGDTCGYNSDRVITCTEVRNAEDPKVMVISNNVLAMNIGFKLEWEYQNPLTDILEPESSTRYSFIYVEKQEDGSYKMVGTEDDQFYYLSALKKF